MAQDSTLNIGETTHGCFAVTCQPAADQILHSKMCVYCRSDHGHRAASSLRQADIAPIVESTPHHAAVSIAKGSQVLTRHFHCAEASRQPSLLSPSQLLDDGEGSDTAKDAAASGSGVRRCRTNRSSGKSGESCENCKNCKNCMNLNAEERHRMQSN